MMRNDYRRSLILLRSNASGYSGHVRLERRTLMGTMYFLVQSPGDCPTLRAALVGRNRDGGYFACALGELQQDARGQAVLGYTFDPRDICRRELEQYQLIALTCAGDESCQVVLFGNVCGHAELNWEGVRAALCELYAVQDGAAQGAGGTAQGAGNAATGAGGAAEVTPGSGASINAGAGSAAQGAGNAATGAGSSAQGARNAAGAIPSGGASASTGAGDSSAAALNDPAAQGSPLGASGANFANGIGATLSDGGASVGVLPGEAISMESAPSSGEAAQFVEIAPGEAAMGAGSAGDARILDGSFQPAQIDAAGVGSGQAITTQSNTTSTDTSQADAGQTGAAGSTSALACDLLEERGVPLNMPWPGAAEALRSLFRTAPALTEAPDDQCVYVEAPMPEGSGFPFVAAGILALGGALAAIRYALPAAWTEEPPAGLEDCTWIGDQNAGWWVTEIPLD